jgi:hypothetical protein
MDPRVTELRCIKPMENIGSLMRHGIFFERVPEGPVRVRTNAQNGSATHGAM